MSTYCVPALRAGEQQRREQSPCPAFSLVGETVGYWAGWSESVEKLPPTGVSVQAI